MQAALATLIDSLDELESYASALKADNGRYQQALASGDVAEIGAINDDVRARLAVLERLGEDFRDDLRGLAAAVGAADYQALFNELSDADGAVLRARLQGLRRLMRQMSLTAASSADLMFQAEAIDDARRNVN